MEAKRILIVGNYGAGNLGDDSILAGILTELKLVGFKGKIEVMHGGFESSTDIYKGLKKVPFMPTGLRSRFKRGQRQAAESAIKRADLVILGGGGLFVDSESWKAPVIWGAQAKACSKIGTPYICYGQSVGPLKYWLSRFITRRVFKNAKAIHVRDSQSAKYLKKLGVSGVIVGSDPAFSWLATKKKRVKRNNALAISIRTWSKRTSEIWEPLLEEVKRFAKKRKLKPILIAMDLRNKKEIESMKKTGLELFEAPSASFAFEGMQRAKMTIAMRLHAGIFALAAGVPLISISYSKKVESLMRTLEIKGGFKLIKVENFSKAKLKKAMPKVISQKKPHFDMESPSRINQNFLSTAFSSVDS